MLTTLAEFTESKSNIVSQTMHQNTAGAGFGTPVTADGDVQLFGHAVAHHSSHLSLSLSLHPHPYLVCSLMPQSPPFFISLSKYLVPTRAAGRLRPSASP